MKKFMPKKIVSTAATCLMTGIFLSACGGSSDTVATESQTKLLADGDVCGAAWSSSVTYVAGNLVSFEGKNYTANWWTQNTTPATNSGAAGSGQPWTIGEACMATTPAVEICQDAWAPGIAYATGSKVMVGYKNYTAYWWTQGQDPLLNNGGAGEGKPWNLGVPCMAIPAIRQKN